MDRQVVFEGATPLETDLLNTNKFAMVGLAKLAKAVLGTATFVSGLACTPTTPASMQVKIEEGEIYSLQNLDGTAYGALDADTTHSLLKQGLLMDAVNLTCPAPTISGNSINYLVQAAYQDLDAEPVVLAYYNASNPAQGYAGPNNSGIAQNTVRKGVCNISVKAGIAATTGTQTTPTPDSGYVGLFVVTVAYGQASIAAGSISRHPNAPIIPAGGLISGFQSQSMTAFTTTGATGAFVLTPSPALTGYAANQRFRVKFHAVGNGSDTINVSGLGGKSLKQYDATGAKVAAVIAANQLADVEYDGVDFILLDPLPSATGATPGQFDNSTKSATTAFVQRALGNFNGFVNLNGGGTLTAAQCGADVQLSGVSGTVNLPLSSQCPAGSTFRIHSTTGNMTIARQGADVIVASGTSASLSSFVIGSGEGVTVVSTGAGAWYIANDGGALKYAQGFSANLSTNGYQQLPSGLIIQWQYATTGGNGNYLQTFPIAFPNAHLHTVLTPNDALGDISMSATYTKVSLTQWRIYDWSGGGNNTTAIHIGY